MRLYLVLLLPAAASCSSSAQPAGGHLREDDACASGTCRQASAPDALLQVQTRVKPAYLPPWAQISLLQRRARLWQYWAAVLEDDDTHQSGQSRRNGPGPHAQSKGEGGSSTTPASGPFPKKRWASRQLPDATVADLQGVFKQDDALAVLHALAVNVGLVIVYAVSFCFLRSRFPLVYMNNVVTGKVPVLRRRDCFGWACACCCRATEEVEQFLGLDGAMFIEFPKFCQRVLVTLIVPLTLVLWPLECASVPKRGGICLSVFNRKELDVGNKIYWAQAGAVWFVVLVVEVHVLLAHRAFAKRRRAWLRRMPPPWSRTILVENIPPRGRSDAELRRCFEERSSPGAVEAAYVVRRTGNLPSLVAAAKYARQKLADANAKWKRSGWAPEKRPTHHGPLGQQVDSIFSFGEEAKSAEKVAEESLERFRRGEDAGEEELMAGSGFVTFRRRGDAALALTKTARYRGQQLQVSEPPDPTDVIYSDLMQEPRERLATELTGYLLVGMVFFFFAPITLAAISLFRLRTLRRYIPLFNLICQNYPRIHHFWDGLVGSIVLNAVMGFVPTIFALIFKHCFALKSELWRQQRVQRWYFYFLMVFVLLVTAVGASLALVYLDLARNPASIFGLLALSLPGASVFYLKFFMYNWACEVMGLTRFMTLIKYLFYRLRYDKEDARQFAEPEDQDYDGIGARSARLTLMMVIALVFSTVSPLVIPLALLHFCLCQASYGYLLMFAEETKRDLGGAFWSMQLRHVQQGLFFFVALMVGILLERAESTQPGVVAAGSFLILVPAHFTFRDLAWERLPPEEAAACDSYPEQAPCGAYEQPELKGL